MRLSLAERCLLLRRRKGWRQEDLARVLGVSRRTVARMEEGKRGSWKRVVDKFDALEQKYRNGVGSRGGTKAMVSEASV